MLHYHAHDFTLDLRFPLDLADIVCLEAMEKLVHVVTILYAN